MNPHIAAAPFRTGIVIGEMNSSSRAMPARPLALKASTSDSGNTVSSNLGMKKALPRFQNRLSEKFSSHQVRHRSTRSLEVRVGNSPQHGFAWLAGVYAFELQEGLNDASAGVYADPFDATQNSASASLTSSHYRSRSAAAYAQLDGDLGRPIIAVGWSPGDVDRVGIEVSGLQLATGIHALDFEDVATVRPFPFARQLRQLRRGRRGRGRRIGLRRWWRR